MTSKLNVGDIIQITKEDDPWFPALLIVREVYGWGVQAYMRIPMLSIDSERSRNAYRRLKSGLFEKVGTAAVTVV